MNAVPALDSLPLPPGRPLVVLMIEDDPDHAFLTEAVLRDSGLPLSLWHCASGDSTLAFLSRQGAYDDSPRPDLILLDLHLPRVSGYQVMEAIAAHPDWRTIPVFVLTSSVDVVDMDAMERLNCAAYLRKPMRWAELAQALAQLPARGFAWRKDPRAP